MEIKSKNLLKLNLDHEIYLNLKTRVDFIVLHCYCSRTIESYFGFHLLSADTHDGYQLVRFCGALSYFWYSR